ncbi:aspartate transaminase aat1 [Gnomoniopsis smithogilvyi]|uniref:Aspartate transaminase aat1 n=1 Tax=Gnomoniopsis smithogilvyi TaxID=1191159 RepID=A0A9W8YP98_9PEZI|nr:aspartate transaminase aat1 [Gnomoniopsis smithogilvyi]
MAGLPVQVGDLVALANIAKTVIEYGWGRYSNAARQHDDFYQDVDSLHRSLLALDSIIKDVGLGVKQQLAGVQLRCDRRSLSEIIGDCQATLDDCRGLLDRNKRFTGSTGPMDNIKYNIFVKSDVEALRKRIRQHVEKISLAQDVLKLDLLSRIQEDIRRMHWDLAVKIEKLHEIVLRIPGMTTDLLNNNVHPNISFEDSSPGIDIPASAEQLFEAAYQSFDGPTCQPSLSNLTDAFLSSFYASTYKFQPGLDLLLQRQPPNDQYVNLLKCIWLIGKIQSSEELANAVTDSHWPSYIKELDKQLSRQCARFSGQTWEGLEKPNPLSITEMNTKIWPEKATKDNNIVHIKTEENLEEIFRAYVTRGSENNLIGLSVWRPVQLEQGNNEAADEFRIRFSSANGPLHQSGYPGELDFSLEKATLQPIYAVDQNSRFGGSYIIETGPTTMSRTSTKLDFRSSKAMTKLQHALIGYKVWDNKIFHASVKFVYKSGPKGNDITSQDAFLQLWIPSKMKPLSSGPSSPRDSGISMTLERRFSTLSLARSSAPSIPETLRSTFTAGSTQTVPVQVGGKTPGILHVKPDKPLLVLFTRDPKTGEPLMITLELDALDVNPKRCDCHRKDIKSQQCLNIAMERDAGKEGEPLLGVTRYEAIGENHNVWDVSRLAFEQRAKPGAGRKPWTDLTRLTIKFRDVDERKIFSGQNCGCKNRGRTETWDDLRKCVGQNHRGLLGEIKMHYRLLVWEYDEWRKHRQHVIHRE